MPAEFSSSAPATLAVASLSEDDEPSALNVIAPVAVMSREVMACTVWCAYVTEMEAPTPTLVAWVFPTVVVVTEAVCLALAESAPPIVRRLPDPMLAVVVTLEYVIATTGVIVSFPFEPFWATVVALSVVVESRVRSCAFASVAELSRPVWVSCVIRLSAKEAPMPNERGVPSLLREWSVPLATDLSSLIAVPPLVPESLTCCWGWLESGFWTKTT